MEIYEQIQLEGCNFLRQHVIFSLLSGRPISISKIRMHDSQPGLTGNLLLISWHDKNLF